MEGIKPIVSVTNKKSVQNVSLNINNKTITDDNVISNHFTKFFSYVAGKLVKKIRNTTKTFYLNKQSEKSFFLLHTLREEKIAKEKNAEEKNVELKNANIDQIHIL